MSAAQGRPESLGEATGPTGRGEAGGQKPPATKVYTVWELDYESQDVLSVWTTREAADAELERVKARGYSYGYQVLAHTLNEPWSDE